MKLAPIGRAPDPANLDLDPIIVPVVAYKDDKSEVLAEFPFKPVMPPGAMAMMVRNSGPNGELPANVVLLLLNNCVDADATERWGEFLDSDEHVILQETLGEVLNALTEVYSQRPTRQRSGSQPTGAPAVPTSKAEPPSTE